MKILYEEDVTSEFGEGSKENLIFNYFGLSILENIQKKTIFKKAEFNCESEILTWKKLTYSQAYDSIPLSVAIPLAQHPIDFVKGMPDFVFWISDITIERKPVTDILPGLYWKARFLLWDNSVQKVVLYGCVNVSEGVQYVLTKDNWDNVSNSFVTSLISRLPSAMISQ
jgi:hypothetical protein